MVWTDKILEDNSCEKCLKELKEKIMQEIDNEITFTDKIVTLNNERCRFIKESEFIKLKQNLNKIFEEQNA